MRVKSLLLALGFSFVVGKSFAISFKVDGINYVANADTAIIKGYSEIPENGELKLASIVNYGGTDYRVTTVQGSAFLSCTDIKKLIVPASIKYIQNGAFENCVNMNNLVLEQGDDLLDAASDAFKNCEIEEATIGRNLFHNIFEGNTFLRNVGYAKNVVTISSKAFSGCISLSHVSLENVERIEEESFYECKALKEIEFSKVIELGRYAFSKTGLEFLNLPQEISVVGNGAFADCSSLKEASIKAKINSIPDSCFKGCSCLAEIDYPKTVKTIGKNAFSDCAFTSFVFKGNISVVEKSAFYNCKQLGDIDLNNVEKIGNFAFASTAVTNIVISSKVSELGEGAFSCCSKLKSCTIFANIEKIPNWCFDDCSNLNNVDYPSMVTTIGEFAFENCAFETIVFKPSVRNIEKAAFRNCTKLTEVDFGNIEDIGIEAFCNCALKKIQLPASVKQLQNSSFCSCKDLVSVNMEATNLSAIPKLCFASCDKLLDVTFSPDVKEIGGGAFKNCDGLEKMENEGGIVKIATDAFDNTKYLIERNGAVIIGKTFLKYKGYLTSREYQIPGNVVTLCSKALEKQNFQTLLLPNSLKTIEDGALDNCSDLISLEIPSNVQTVGKNMGCTKLSILSIAPSDCNLTLDAFEKSPIRKLTLKRNLERTIDWIPELKELYIGKNVTNIINGSFASCRSLTDLTLEETDSFIDLKSIPVNRVKCFVQGRNIHLPKYEPWVEKTNTFSSLEEWNIGEKVDSICDDFAVGNPYFVSLVFPNHIKYIGSSAFAGNLNLVNVEIPESVTNIENDLFNGNSKLETVILPNSIKEIGESAFLDTGLKKINFPDALEKIGNHAFGSCLLDSLVLPSNCNLALQCFYGSKVKYADISRINGSLNWSFAFCKELEEIKLPKNGLTEIEREEFWEDHSLRKIEIPSTVTKIGYSAFQVTALENLVIPESVKEVDVMILGNPRSVPSLCIDGSVFSEPIYMKGSLFNSLFDSNMNLKVLQINRSITYDFDISNGTDVTVSMDSLVIGNIKQLSLIPISGHNDRFVPTTAICLSHYLTSCAMWKPTNGKVFVLPGSQLPKDDITYMYTVNKLDYTQDTDGNVLFDGVNNMPYEITPVFYQDEKEVELKEAGVYDLSMKISGTSFDGIYPTGLKVTVASSTGINRVTLDGESQHCPIYNMNGQRVDECYKGIVIQNGKKRIAK